MRSLFFLARHGQTALNELGMYRGWSNGPDAQLNEDGVASADAAGFFLQKLGQKFSTIICSPLERTQLTAAIIAGYLGVKNLTLDDRLKPLNVGDFAGTFKKQNPVHPYLADKNKRFPGGETVNEFEQRQHEFATELVPIIEAQKSTEDAEVLVVAHVSNVMYWWNVQTSAKSDEYLGESTDIIDAGGIAMVTENSTFAIFKPNESLLSDRLDYSSIKGAVGTGYEPAGGKGPFSCGNCEYFKHESCGQKDMMRKSKQPRTSDGRIKVDVHGCCEYVERVGEKNG